MRTWSITEARSNMSDVYDAAIERGPQKIERRDSEPVIVISEADWRKLTTAYPTIADLILNAPFEDEDLPARRPARAIERGYF